MRQEILNALLILSVITIADAQLFMMARSWAQETLLEKALRKVRETARRLRNANIFPLHRNDLIYRMMVNQRQRWTGRKETMRKLKLLGKWSKNDSLEK